MHRHGPDGPFDRVVIKLYAAVVEESAECWPAREGVADRLGQGAIWRDTAKLVIEPDLHGRDEWSRLDLTHPSAILRGSPANALLDGVDLGDPAYRLGGDR